MIRLATLTLTALALAPAASAVAAHEMPAPSFAVGDTGSYRESDLLTKNETGPLKAGGS